MMPYQFTVRLEHHEAPHEPGATRSFNVSEFRDGRTIPSTVDYVARAVVFGEEYAIEVWELAAAERVRFGVDLRTTQSSPEAERGYRTWPPETPYERCSHVLRGMADYGELCGKPIRRRPDGVLEHVDTFGPTHIRDAVADFDHEPAPPAPTGPPLDELADRALAAMANDTRTEDEKIDDGVAFIVDGTIGDDEPAEGPEDAALREELRATLRSFRVDADTPFGDAFTDALVEFIKGREKALQAAIREAITQLTNPDRAYEYPEDHWLLEAVAILGSAIDDDHPTWRPSDE